MKYILLLLILIYIFVQGTKNFSKTVLGIYSLVLIIPISGTEYIDTSSMLKIGSINVLEIAVVFLFVLGVIRRKILVLKKDLINILAMCLMCIYVIGVLVNFEKARCIADAKDYILPLLLFFCMRAVLRSENSFEVYIQTTLKGLRINAFIILVGYFVYWLPSGLNGRYGFGCESLYVFSIPIQVYFCLNNSLKKDKIRNIWGASIQTFLVLINQTRSLILCLILIFVCYLAIGLFKRNSGHGFVRKIVLLVVVIFVGGMGYNYLLINASSLSGWMYRMSELFDYGMETKSNTIRLALINYYLPKIFSNPFGYGFGVSMPVWDFTTPDTLSLVSGEALAIDNLLITYIYKLGVIPGIVYIAVYVKSFYKLLKIKTEISGLTIIRISCLVLIIPTMIMSVQGLKYLSIASFYWGIIATIPTIKGNSIGINTD